MPSVEIHLRIGAAIGTGTASARAASGAGSEGAASLPPALGGGRLDHLGGVDAVLVHLPLHLGRVARSGVVLVAAAAADGAGLHRLVLAAVADARGAGDGLALPDGPDGGRLLLVEVGLRIVSHGGRGLLLHELGLLLLEAGQLGVDVRVDAVDDVLAVEDLGDGVEAPLLVLEVVDLPVVGSPDAGSAVLPHEVAGGLLGRGGVAHGLVAGAIGEAIAVAVAVAAIVVVVVVLGDGISRPRPPGPALVVGGAQQG